MANDNTIDTNVKNKENTKMPAAGFNVHPENINRKGRPLKGHSITETIKAMMDEKPEIKKALGAKILQMAMDGDITAMKTIWNYIDGMPLQKSEIGGVDGEPISFTLLRGADYVPPTRISTEATSSGGTLSLKGEVQDDSVAPEGKENDNGPVSDNK